MKKQFTAVTMAAFMAAAALAGCSSKPAETEAPATEAATEAAETEAAEAAEETEAAEAAETNGTLVMATNAEFPPYEFREGGEIVGIDVEIAAAIAAQMGMDFEVEDIAFDSIIPAVQSGKADFGAAGMTVTEDRKQSVDFSESYATATQVIIVKEDNAEIATPDDLEGRQDHRCSVRNHRRYLCKRYSGCNYRAVQQGLRGSSVSDPEQDRCSYHRRRAGKSIRFSERRLKDS